MSDKTYSEKVAAADKSIGFEFQYYYFLKTLLSLKPGETVGLEVLDDVHTELSNNRQILVQLKHTTQTNATGLATNLTTLDGDLWKTLSNWSQIITDPNAGRKEKPEQLRFIEKTDFLLVSNKSENQKNKFLNAVLKFKSDGKILEIELLLADLLAQTSDSAIKDYIQQVQKLDTQVLQGFFRNLYFDLGNNDLVEKCKLEIKGAKIAENKIDFVFSGIDSQVRADNFITIQNGKKIIISFDDFYRKYRRYYDLSRNENLLIKRFNSILPGELSSQKFIQQLVDISDIKSDDIATMAKYSQHRLQMQNNLDDWHTNGDITQDEIKTFDDEARTRWENEYRRTYRQCTDAEIPQKALDLIDHIRREKLRIAATDLPTDMCNGQYYRLSDTPDIGWHKDWQNKYK
jgi:hypothetical protein